MSTEPLVIAYEGKIPSQRCEYRVWMTGKPSIIEPIVLTVSSGVATLQDYLTPEQALELAAELTACANLVTKCYDGLDGLHHEDCSVDA